MNKKAAGILSAIAASALVLSACSNGDAGGGSTGDATDAGGGGATSNSELTIGMAFQEMNNEYFVVMQEAFVEAAESIGAKHIETDASHDVAKQISQVEDMIQQGIDILLINPADTAGIAGAMQTAHDAGVIIVAIDAQADGPVDTFVGSKNYDAGYMSGQQMIEDLNGEGKVAILDGIPVTPILDRVEGFRDAVAEAPGIEIVDIQNGKQERDIALGVVENMLSANKDLAAIFSVNDTGSMGALAAVQASGSDTLIYSVDGAPEAVAAIAEGGAFKQTSAQFPRDQVRIGLGMALAKYWGATVVPEVVPVDVHSVVQSNAADFSW